MNADLSKDASDYNSDRAWHVSGNNFIQIIESGKSTNFNKLIRKGVSNTISKPQGFMNEGQLIIDIDKQSKGFSRFYEDLAVPQQLEQFDSNYQENTQLHIELIRQIVQESCDTFSPTMPAEIGSAILKLNNNKSSDEFGICAEHLKFASPTIFRVLSVLFNAIIEHCHIPLQFLSGIITPVHRKGNDAADFGNYKGITVSCSIGKVLEHVTFRSVIITIWFHQKYLTITISFTDQRIYHSEYPTSFRKHFYGTTLGIKDPSVFKIPAICKKIFWNTQEIPQVHGRGFHPFYL
ncbi:unnamed protein product [Mytilus coruscus]|uniref:Reverse transcriptase domain-containing protein n=1 Tax=Mytilus coruscus TaxID=42192 RepID=A0A6J8E0D4_MYTCO|nr:unnamed protein product [Mytilus coruscus]